MSPSHITNPPTSQQMGKNWVTFPLSRYENRFKDFKNLAAFTAPKSGVASLLPILTSVSFQGPERLPCAVQPSWQTRRGEVKMK